MAKISDGELNPTMDKVMQYLHVELKDGAKRVSYSKIAKKYGKSYHSIKYSIDRLCKMGMLHVVMIDNEAALSL